MSTDRATEVFRMHGATYRELPDRKLVSTNRNNQPKLNDFLSKGLHPGWWFSLGFPNLDTEGQIAWLELLTLAISTHPLGRVMFNNRNFMAHDLNLTETGLSSALSEATGLGVVEHERIGTIITPENPIFGLISYKGMVRPDWGTLYAFGHEFSFPGIYTYGEHLETGGWLVKERPISRAQRRDLDAALEKPLELLRGRMPATDRAIDLDKPADDKAPLQPIDSARLDLFAWMSNALTEDLGAGDCFNTQSEEQGSLW